MKTANLKGMEQVTLVELLSGDLSKFKIEKMIEAYTLDEEGKSRDKSLGFFKNEEIARAIVSQQEYPNRARTEPAFVLNNGEVAVVIKGVDEKTTFFNDELGILIVRQNALQKLNEQERKVLGLG